MLGVWGAIRRGYLRLVEPLAHWLVRRGVSPNALTVAGTLSLMVVGVLFALGYMRTAGWTLGVVAVFDVLDGRVAHLADRQTPFGAFFDSTLDRVGDGALFGGLTVFFATHPGHANGSMVVVCLAGLVGSFLTSYTRARAENLGVDARVGIIQRPERITLLAAPQAFFGLALNGAVLMAVVALLTLTSWITVGQRVRAVARATR